MKEYNLDEFDQESRDEIERWIKELPELEELQNLKKHYLVERFINILQSEIDQIENTLKTKRSYGENLVEAEVIRLSLFTKLDLYKKFIQYFSPEERLKLINSQLKELE